MTQDDGKKPPKRDPFAPLPLSEDLTGRTSKPAPREASTPTPVAVEPPVFEPPSAVEPTPPALPAPAASLPPTAFTPRDAPVAPVEADARPVDEAWTEAAAPASEPASVIVEPALPSTYDENELRDAVGATPLASEKKKPEKKRATTDDGDGDDDERPRSKLWMFVAALTAVVGGGITAMILVGRANSERYLITCEADRVVIQQGRSFPPWGESEMEGGEWRALKIPAEAPCSAFETKDKAELAARFGKMLEERATTLVGGRGGSATPTSAAGPEDPVGKVDEAEANLKQALLVSRSLRSDDALDARERIERLLGDVTYWRASARLRAAADALADAAKQFDAAALQKPRTMNDAGGWAIHARRLADQLRAGPGGESTQVFPPVPPTENPTTTKAPPGVALPVEPPPTGSATEPAPPPIDAGAPSGGVLL